jgi:hypothetical protein
MLHFENDKSMRYLTLTLIIMIPILVFGQNRIEKTDTIYVDNFMSPVNRESAKFFYIFDTIAKTDYYSSYIQKVYYLNGQIKDSCAIRHDYSGWKWKSPYRYGICKTYYCNGQLTCEQSYKEEGKNREFVCYYGNGQLESRGKILDYNTRYLYSYFDSLGNSYLTNGNGLVCEYDSSLNCNRLLVVKDSLILISYHIDTTYSDTIYDLIDSKLEPIQGWQKFRKQMTKLKIEKSKMKEYSGKRLLFEIVVYENGRVGRITPLNSISEELDTIIIAEIKRLAIFNEPKLKNGKRVKVRYVLPLIAG